MKTALIEPQDFLPSPDELLGDAKTACGVILRRIERQQPKRDAKLKLLLCGDPGVGKTRIGQILAERLVGEHHYNVKRINGRDLTCDFIRDFSLTWMQSLYGDWMVLQVDELDVCPKPAQDALLTMLDDMPGRRAFIATSNLHLEDLSARLQSRLQYYRLNRPDPEEIENLLRRWTPPLDPEAIKAISQDCQGNVRSALLDAQSLFDNCDD